MDQQLCRISKPDVLQYFAKYCSQSVQHRQFTGLTMYYNKRTSYRGNVHNTEFLIRGIPYLSLSTKTKFTNKVM